VSVGHGFNFSLYLRARKAGGAHRKPEGGLGERDG
jgi:hypothetical protein